MQAGTQLELLVFDAGGIRCGVALASVCEIVRAVALTPLPSAPAIVEGVINYRGSLLPVLDVRRALGRRDQGPPALSVSDHFIVVRSGERRAVLHAQSRVQVVQQPALERDPGQAAAELPGVTGAAQVEGELVVIYDLEAFLSQADARQLDRALEAGSVEGASSTWPT